MFVYRRRKTTNGKYKKVLIIKISSMGDVIFNIPLANILKKNNYEVHWLVGEKGISLLENNPCVDKVIVAPFEKWKKQKNRFKNLKEYFAIIKELRQENYDIILDTQMRLKSLLFTIFSNAKRRIISDDAKEFSKFGANEVIKKKRDKNSHVVESYLEFARYLGLNTEKIEFTLPDTDEKVKNKVSQILQNIDTTKPVVMLSPATTWRGKHWDKDNWKELVNKIHQDYNLFFTGTLKDNDLIEYIQNGKGTNITGQTNILELLELLRNTDLLISLDSGTTHLAWATQHPKILSIYCCTPKTLYSPIGSEDKYIGLNSELCQPCHHKKCTKNTEKYICTKSPSVDIVLREVQKLLNGRCYCG